MYTDLSPLASFVLEALLAGVVDALSLAYDPFPGCLAALHDVFQVKPFEVRGGHGKNLFLDETRLVL